MADSDGVMRLRGTRVTPETIVAAFTHGATAEEIVQQYPSVALADVYQGTARPEPTLAIPAAESALRSHPCVALSSVQVSPF